MEMEKSKSNAINPRAPESPTHQQTPPPPIHYIVG